MTWINVKDELPELKHCSYDSNIDESEPVLVFSEGKEIAIATLTKLIKDFNNYSGFKKGDFRWGYTNVDFYIRKVTHWQHLPKKPKGLD